MNVAERLVEILEENGITHIFGIPGETAAFARELHEKHPCYVLSNTNIEHLEFVKEKAPELLFMDGWIPSYEVHALKPEAAFFERALKIVNEEASNCLLIDDRLENVEGARAVGIKSVLYRGLAELKEELNGQI